MKVETHCGSENIPMEGLALGDGRYKFGFVPRSTQPHMVSVVFSKQHVAGSPFRLTQRGYDELDSGGGRNHMPAKGMYLLIYLLIYLLFLSTY